jgi:hypothetical protein
MSDQCPLRVGTCHEAQSEAKRPKDDNDYNYGVRTEVEKSRKYLRTVLRFLVK